MKAAVVYSAGQIPVYDNFPTPRAEVGQCVIQVKAAALSPITRARAAGAHYSANASYPLVVGVDGVGVTSDGQRVYFANPNPPYGAMAEAVMVSPKQCIAVPDDLADTTAAALANPGMSAWMALRERAAFQTGETVLVNGATGSSGSLAVQIARHFGAKRIIATGRNPKVLRELKSLGADDVISLTGDLQEQREAFEAAFAGGIDVVLDYLWGTSAQLIIAASTKIPDHARPLRFIQIGSVSGEEITLSSALLRFRANLLLGSGVGSVAPDRMVASVRDLLACASKAGFKIAVETAALTEVTDGWQRDTENRRLVFTL